MRSARLTNKQRIIRLCLLLAVLLILLLGGWMFVLVRPYRHWKPAAVTVQVREAEKNPYINPEGMTQESRILPPEGFTRTEAPPHSFLAFMRNQPLYENGSLIYTYDGGTLPNSNAAAVYALSVGAEGYQECADTIIRFWSEYLWANNRKDRLAFHLTNGKLCDYGTFSRGNRIAAVGKFAVWLPVARSSDDEQTFHDWLMTVMRYAGTRSLAAESVPVSVQEAHTGDFLCHGGSPGHAVLIADEAVNENGERVFLLANGYMPAQSAYILAGYNCDPNPWYTQAQLSADPVCLSTYTFEGTGVLRRHTGAGIN